jgi:oxygen-independent coproporphyrinogen-3 oxidase
MSGIYIHIPFCKKTCHYCDFHFSTQLKWKKDMSQALIKEIGLRAHYLSDRKIKTIYWGGGTPSLLTPQEMEAIFGSLHKHFTIEHKAEITLEANPDDIHEESLKVWQELGVNRISLGVQTFDEDRLRYLNRSHNARQAESALDLIGQSDIEHTSADLIFAIPPENSSFSRFKKDLEKLLAFSLDHISLYHLTIEPQTVFGKWMNRGQLDVVTEDSGAQQYEWCSQRLQDLGWDHYEVSNFAFEDGHSRHNASYWQQNPYLGIGPGAHSFNGNERGENFPNNAMYMKLLAENTLPHKSEKLSKITSYNEYVMTGLRTKWGIDLQYIKNSYGFDIYDMYKARIHQWIDMGHAVLENQNFWLTAPQGFAFADGIAAAFFEDE